MSSCLTYIFRFWGIFCVAVWTVMNINLYYLCYCIMKKYYARVAYNPQSKAVTRNLAEMLLGSILKK